MAKRLGKLKSLRERSLDELRVRGTQKLCAYMERAGLSKQARVPSDEAFFRLLKHEPGRPSLRAAEELLEHFRTRTTPSFFPAFDEREATSKVLLDRFGAEAQEKLIGRANKIVEGRFDLLGLRDLSFGSPPDWHLEPVAGLRAPRRHWSQIAYLDREAAGDKKIIWELNRHQYFSTLGRAYWRTRDERYSKTFIKHLESWMDENPPKLGINWASSLEVAFRSIAWLWALYFFKDSRHLTPPVFLRALKFLYVHARHLETYLSTYFSPNTHLTGEALGLFYMGTVLPEFARAERWRNIGRSILLSELDRHVLADGVYFEQSSYYHRYTTDFYMHLLILSELNGESIESKHESGLVGLLDHLMHITRPDGTTPLFGDDDGGRLCVLDERASDDFRAAHSTGAALLDRGDYKFVAGELAEETVWLLGSDGASTFDRLAAEQPAQTSRAFTSGGYYVMRDGWTRASNYLLMDCGPHGSLSCGHAHADALSINVAARGRTVLVDAGTYTYTGSPEMRDLFRSSAAHNTLVVDGESSSVPAGPFSWSHVARARALRWMSRSHFDFLEGEHDGYSRLPQPVTHTRTLLFIKNRYWVMRDRVKTEGTHALDLYFHFAPDVRDSSLEIFAFGRDGRWREDEGWVSTAYGARSVAPVRVFSAHIEGAQEIITFLIPRDAALGQMRVRELEAARGRAFEVLNEETRDVLLIGEQGGEASGINSDFEWSWTRSTRKGLKELVLVDGQSFSVDGKEIVKAAERVSYLSASRAGEGLFVETPPRASLTMSSLGARALNLNGEAFETSGAEIYLSGGSFVGSQESAPAETFV